MRVILISVALVFMSGQRLAQQRRQPSPSGPRTVVPDEPLPCVALNSMAARLDAVYKTEDISKTEYEEGMKKYRDGTQIEGGDYFIGGERKNQKKKWVPWKGGGLICW